MMLGGPEMGHLDFHRPGPVTSRELPVTRVHGDGYVCDIIEIWLYREDQSPSDEPLPEVDGQADVVGGGSKAVYLYSQPAYVRKFVSC